MARSEPCVKKNTALPTEVNKHVLRVRVHVPLLVLVRTQERERENLAVPPFLPLLTPALHPVSAPT